MHNPVSIVNPVSAQQNMKRWWIYQRERFPLGLNGLAILVFSFAATGYGWEVTNREGTPGFVDLLVSFICSFIFFVLLRIADEFKDFADDSRFRPYRAVPRGLVKLTELGKLGVILTILQIIMTLFWSIELFLLLIGIWIYFLLMSREFFVPGWLRAHPLVYLVSHMLIMPLIALFATAPAWLDQQFNASDLSWFLILSFCVGLTGEIGRKIRASDDEEIGVETYSSLWGRTPAVAFWLLSVFAVALSAGLASRIFAPDPRFDIALATACVISIATGWYFVRRPKTASAKAIEAMSGLWALFSFGALATFAFFPVFSWS